MIRVINRARWHRTKIAIAIILFVVAVASSGGFESQDGVAPMPSFAMFVTSISLFAWLFINIIKTGD